VRKTWFFLLTILVTIATLRAHGASNLRVGVGDSAAAQRVYQLLNQARRQAGLPLLVWNDQLAQAALAHTHQMVAANDLSHQFSGEPTVFNRIAQAGASFDREGENVAFAADADAIHDALMHSPPHRENILSPSFDAVGIAAVRRGEDLFVTQDFAHLLRSMSDAELSGRIAGNVQSLRASAGLRSLARQEGAALAADACQMAGQDRLAAREIRVPGASYVDAFNLLEPDNLPSSVRQLAINRDIDSYAVGSCFARTKTYPAGVYWVVMAFYPGSRAGRR
jgi:hypothetical protein